MRDPARIDRILAILGDYWRRHPDLRLGQIVVNATPRGEPCSSVFYVEDDVIEAELRAAVHGPDIIPITLPAYESPRTITAGPSREMLGGPAVTVNIKDVVGSGSVVGAVKMLHACRTCDRSGWAANGYLPDGWSSVDNIDGPNAICPACAAEPTSLDALREDGYPDAKVRAIAEGR